MEKTLTANFLLHLAASICSFKLNEEKRCEQKDKTEEQMKKTFNNWFQAYSSITLRHYFDHLFMNSMFNMTD